MAFEKGNKLATGRPKNSQNKTTGEIKEAFNTLLSTTSTASMHGLKPLLKTTRQKQ